MKFLYRRPNVDRRPSAQNCFKISAAAPPIDHLVAMLERQFHRLAVPHDRGGHPDHGLELGGGGIRAGLLNETQR